MIDTEGALKSLGVLVLANSERTFHLTGSRYFGTSRSNSDYDFFVQYDKGIEQYLSGLGFEQEWANSYDDPIAHSCWSCGNIHVQVVTDAKLKKRVQDWLKTRPALMVGTKEQLRGVWTTAICAFVDLVPIGEYNEHP